MPISSSSRFNPAGATDKKRTYWPNATQHHKKLPKIANKQPFRAAKYKEIQHISPPSPLTATSSVPNIHHPMTPAAKRTDPISELPTAISIAGQMVLTSSKQPGSIGSLGPEPDHFGRADKQAAKGDYIVSNAHFGCHNSQAASQTSLQPTTTTSSTAQLHSLGNITSATPMSIRRNMKLKSIKTIILLLMVVDLTITLFVHQFSSQDQLNIWFTSYKLRFSMLNLALSSVWFILLAGAILFDVYVILIIACLLDVVSLFLLVCFSVYHFSRRIDYNTVNLTSLLLLLFGIVLLHVYLLVLSLLTIYLTLAVKRRQK